MPIKIRCEMCRKRSATYVMRFNRDAKNPAFSFHPINDIDFANWNGTRVCDACKANKEAHATTATVAQVRKLVPAGGVRVSEPAENTIDYLIRH